MKYEKGKRNLPFFSYVYNKYHFEMANIDKIKVSGTTYDIKDSNAITQIKTINGQTLVGEGNIQIEGGSGGSTNVIELTQAEYDALQTKDSSVLYLITDAEEINANDYVTKASNIASDTTLLTLAKCRYEYSYSDAINTIYIAVGNNEEGNNSGNISGVEYYISENSTNSEDIYFSYNSGEITGTSSNINFGVISFENGMAKIVFNDGYYFRKISDFSPTNDKFSIYIPYKYSSGQSKSVIENTIYSHFNELAKSLKDYKPYLEKINNFYLSEGRIILGFTTQNSYPSFQINLTSNTIKGNDKGLYTVFKNGSTTILNTGTDYYYIFYPEVEKYSEALDSITITVNPDYTGSTTQDTITVYQRNEEESNSHQFGFNYTNSTFNIPVGDTEYYEVIDNLSTNGTFTIRGVNGRRITYCASNNWLIGGVDIQDKSNYMYTLVTTNSKAVDGQKVIDDIYSKIGNVETLLSQI